MVMDVKQTYCGGHFTIYTGTESLGCPLEANIILYINYISIIKKKKGPNEVHSSENDPCSG